MRTRQTRSNHKKTQLSDCLTPEGSNIGESPPDAGDFSQDGTSTIDYSSPLTGCPPGAGMNAGMKDPFFSPLPRELNDAMSAYLEGDLTEAIRLFQIVVGNSRNALWIRRWAMNMLLACAQQSDISLASYLETARDTYPDLVLLANFLLPHVYLDEDRLADAISLFDTNIRSYPGTELERDGLYGKFLNLLYAARDTGNAAITLESLETRFAESDEALIAREQYETFTNTLVRESLGKGQEQGTDISEIPDGYGLEQNYPNPFNPVTTIRYSLPVAGKTTLIVYDMLGREITRLVDGVVEAWYHEVIFDAGSLASGVYFYELHAGAFADVKRLLLIR
jgi:hypothetical protein